MDPSAVAEQPAPPSGDPAADAASTPTSSATPPPTTISLFGVAARDRLRKVIQAGPIGWAAYLACSWTWCIGMFLPVLFLRDYGWWGWLLFTVPNVVGAAAMGWMLRDPDASRAMQQAHVSACRAFSLITLAFHAFFVIALVPRLIGGDVAVLTAVLVFPFLLLLRGRGRGGRRATVSSAVALSVSMIALFAVLALRGLPVFPPPVRRSVELVWLAPVVFFGFLLDPYLDLTFHRARQSTTRAGGRTAFGLGFGVFFLLMVVFTACYAPPLMDALASGQPLPPRQDLLAAVLTVHIALQSAFTVAAHLDVHGETRPSTGFRIVLPLAAVIVVALLLRLLVGAVPAYHGMTTGEAVYRLFLAFYGLAFPAYVWLVAIPRRSPGRGRRPAVSPTRGQVFYFLAVVVLAAPMYWLSFIEGRMMWAVPGVALVLLSRFLVPRPAAAPGPVP